MVSKVIYKNKHRKFNFLNFDFYFWFIKKTIKNNELVLFIKSVLEFLNVKNDIFFALESSLHCLKNKNKKIFNEILHDLKKGLSFSKALEKSGVFQKNVIDMVLCGEKNNNIKNSFVCLKDFLEWELEQKSKLKSILFYPLFSLLVLIFIIFMFSFFVIPTLFEVVLSFNQDCVNNFMIFNQVIFGLKSILLSVSIFSIFLFALNFKNKNLYQKIIFQIPFIGNLMKNYYIFINSYYLSTYLSQGSAIKDAFDFLVISNEGYLKIFFQNMKKHVDEGGKINSFLSKYNFIEKILISVVKTGEETGNLTNSFSIVKQIFFDKYQASVSKLINFLPIFIIFFNALFMVLFIYLIFTPMYSLSF